MSYYFFKITATYTDKNRLYKEFREYVKNFDACLLKGDAALEHFKKRINERLDGLNAARRRCKPIDLGFYDRRKQHGGSILMSVEGSWFASINEVKLTLG